MYAEVVMFQSILIYFKTEHNPQFRLPGSIKIHFIFSPS